VNYRPQLDGLRAAAVVLVFLHHWTDLGGRLGIVGVQIFFVLSGFLITGILLREKTSVGKHEQTVGYSLRQFYARRVLRIFPVYYACLALFVALNLFDAREVFVWHALYLSNVFFFLHGGFSDPFSHYFAHFWSLAVEEQFYLLWPFLVFVIPIRKLGKALLLIVAAAPLSRVMLYYFSGPDFTSHSILLISNLDTLGLGALAAWWQHQYGGIPVAIRRVARWLVPLCVAEIVLVRVLPVGRWIVLVDSFAVAIAGLYLVVTAARGFGGPVGSLLGNPVALYLGKISYGLYIWHMFAPPFVRNILKGLGLPEAWNHGAIGVLLLTAWTVATSSLSWFLLEKPINNLKKFFPYQRTTPTT
jgi:peptidoglycan/LPS O-acetylase OafA/YrhL